MKNSLNDSHFDILGVSRQSTKEEIKKAYRKQSMLWHPDKFFNDKDEWVKAHQRFIKISEAYNLLQNYEPRKPKTVPKEDKTNYKAAQKGGRKRAEINRVKVKSSNIYAIGYDNEIKILQIEFLDKSIYQYYEVPENIYNDFMQSESKGKFAHKYILFQYRYEQV